MHLIKTRVDPQAGRIDHLQHRLTCHHGRARIGTARRHQPCHRRHQPQIAALGLQGRTLRTQACCLAAAAAHRGIGHLQLLLLGLRQFAAAGLGGIQVAVTPGLSARKGLACLCLALRCLGPTQGSLLCLDALVQIHRIHLAQHLPCLHGVAGIHIHALQPPGIGRADPVGITRLHRANAIQPRSNRTRLHPGHGDRHRCQGPGTQPDPGEHRHQHQHHQCQPQRASPHRQLQLHRNPRS